MAAAPIAAMERVRFQQKKRRRWSSRLTTLVQGMTTEGMLARNSFAGGIAGMLSTECYRRDAVDAGRNSDEEPAMKGGPMQGRRSKSSNGDGYFEINVFVKIVRFNLTQSIIKRHARPILMIRRYSRQNATDTRASKPFLPCSRPSKPSKTLGIAIAFVIQTQNLLNVILQISLHSKNRLFREPENSQYVNFFEKPTSGGKKSLKYKSGRKKIPKKTIFFSKTLFSRSRFNNLLSSEPNRIIYNTKRVCHSILIKKELNVLSDYRHLGIVSNTRRCVFEIWVQNSDFRAECKANHKELLGLRNFKTGPGNHHRPTDDSDTSQRLWYAVALSTFRSIKLLRGGVLLLHDAIIVFSLPRTDGSDQSSEKNIYRRKRETPISFLFPPNKKRVLCLCVCELKGAMCFCTRFRRSKISEKQMFDMTKGFWGVDYKSGLLGLVFRSGLVIDRSGLLDQSFCLPLPQSQQSYPLNQANNDGSLNRKQPCILQLMQNVNWKLTRPQLRLILGPIRSNSHVHIHPKTYVLIQDVILRSNDSRDS
ncbi:hypothetical protein LXL04_001023 [Taraxacum kok-saghyz]